MTTTISGHTIPVRDMDHSDRLHAYAETLDQDQLERWLYAGAPEQEADQARLDAATLMYELIETSQANDSIAHGEWFAELHHALTGNANLDSWVENGAVYEYWGEDEYGKWRIHLATDGE